MRVIYNLITKEVAAVIDDGGTSTTAYPVAEYGIIQGDTDAIQKMAIALELDVTQIPNIDMSDALKKVIKDRQMGNKLFNRFLSENKEIDISTTQNIQQLQALINVKMMLDAGALGTARDMLTQIPDESFLVTLGYSSSTERKQSYIDEINNYINSQNPEP